MDYNDNEYQSENLQLAGEGNSKFPPVLRPYALPKFDFDESLPGHLRFDSLVETEVFLGIESNEDNQWIEEYSRGGSGIEFRTSAAESCSISRHNNVWSEATSSESVEMLLKSVGQEENNTGKTMRESDSCDELGCVVKQMEPGPKHDDDDISKGGDITDIQPMLPPDEILGNVSASKEDFRRDQPQIDASFQKNECRSSVDGGLGDPVSDAISGKGNLVRSKESYAVDELKVDTSIESQNDRTEEDSSASAMPFDSVVTSASNISRSGNELYMHNAPPQKNSISDNICENIGDLQTEISDQQHECGFVQGTEANCQNLDRNVADSSTLRSENPLSSSSVVESLEEANIIKAATSETGEFSNMLKEDTDFHRVEGCDVNVQASKHVSQVAMLDSDVCDTSEVNVHETLHVTSGWDSRSQGHGVEVSNPIDSRASLLLPEENKLSEIEVVENCGSSIGGLSTSDMEHSASQMPSGKPVDLTSEGLNVVTEVRVEHTNIEANNPSFIVAESIEVCEGNVASGQSGVEFIAADVKESIELHSDRNNMHQEVIEGSTENKLIVSKSHSNATASKEPAPEDATLVPHEMAENVPLHSEDVAVANASIINQEVQILDACDEESQRDSQVEVELKNEVSQECVKDMDGCTAVSDSTRKVQGAEVQVISEKREVTTKENLGKTSPIVSDAESLPTNNEAPAQPLPLEDVHGGTEQNGQGDNELKLTSGDKTSGQVADPGIDGDALKIQEVSISSTPLSETGAKFPPVESGSSAAYPDKSTCGSPTVIRATELSESVNKKQGARGSTDQNNPASQGIDGDANKVQSVSPDLKGADAPKVDKTFTFEVSPLADSSRKEAVKNWQPFSTVQATSSPTVEGTPTSGVWQSNPKIVLDLSRGNLQVSDKEIVCSVSKGTSERKTRRTSSKAAGKEAAKKGIKDTTAARQSEKGDRTSNVPLSSSGICQVVQLNEMQYGHLDNSMKPFVLTTSASALPDLNTSSPLMFQQPFTDLQQVQLRAQIFVYGALIQGSVPDEPYMISAFGGPDGGRSMWETVWRACSDRLHGQKSLLNNAETPLQLGSGARASDQETKHGTIPGIVVSSPVGRAISKGTPSPPVNPIIPLSSPLWSIPTPSADTMQSSGMPRSSVMDYQQSLSPLNAHQTPSMKNFVGHNPSWMSQAPFRSTWVASPQTSGFDAGPRFPVLPITETVHLAATKEPSETHSSGVKRASSGPMIQSLSPATAFPGTSSMLDPKKIPSSQHSTDPKPRKRKKILASEGFEHIMLHSQSHTEPVSSPIISSHVSASVPFATPASLVSKPSTEKVLMPLCPAASVNLRVEGKKETEQRASLSEETLTKLKGAKLQAEDAAAFAAAAVSNSEELWKQLVEQKNSGFTPAVESRLASAAAAIAAAAAVAKAAAAAANVASSAALQAKLMADEALDSRGNGNSSQINGTSLSDSAKDIGKATPASILKGENAMCGSNSIIFAAREAARRQVEAASAASKRAENIDAIVKAAELAAAAVSQAGKIVALGDPLPLDELIQAGPEGYWKEQQTSSHLVAISNDVNSERLNMDCVRDSPDTSIRHPKEVPSESNRKNETNNQGGFPTLRGISGESLDDHARLVDSMSGTVATIEKNTRGHRTSKASDLTKTIGVVPESEIGSPSITNPIEHEGGAEPPKEDVIKQGSCVEVFKDGMQFKAGWYTANVTSLKDGKAYVCYNELPSDGGSEKLMEWVALECEGDEAPKIRIARPVTVIPFEGTRKRRRAAMGEYTWSIGDRVDAWMQNSWWEGVVTEKSKKDETMFTIHFPAQGETSAVRAWHLRPSLIWRDGDWVEWSSSTASNHTSHQGDTPHEKRLRLSSPPVEAKGKDKITKGDGIVESGNPDELTLLDLAANEKHFNIGKSSRDENKPDALRMARTGLQKEGSRVVFGVPKPGKKRKFMDVSKHYVVDQGSKATEANDSVKFAKYLMPQSQGSGPRGWKNALRSEPKEKRPAASRPKVLKSGKQPTVSGRTIPQKDNPTSSAVSNSDDGADVDQTAKIKDFLRHSENKSGKHDSMEFRPMSTTEGTADAPVVFSSMPPSSKRGTASYSRTERVTKGKLAPAAGRLNKVEEDRRSSNISSAVAEPRRSNRRIQPTSRLLEGLQSSLIITKIPSVSHEKSQKSQNRSISKGNNHG